MLEEVLKVMRMWLDMGVDGLRLDAIPYLVEREGTNNENLPETHDVLKAIRAELDRHYPDRMLLAEANQWPEDTRPYFGEGDECHMGFHFPLMPRMYMALAQADRHPITDIIRQTPDIPDGCQWAIFLRNHDELTLEMVTEDERDYLWKFYAEDARARINLGIRRRLAPLMKNDRRKIELLNSHAVLDARHAGRLLRRRDRHGRQLLPRRPRRRAHADAVVAPTATPASPAPTRSSSTCRPIIDPVYGFQAINVEAQAGDPSSLLNWMRRMIARPQAAPGLRPRHDGADLPAQPQDPRLPARARRRDDPLRRQPRRLRPGGGARPVALPRRGADRADRAAPPSRRSATCPTC